ncbi:hypothetical protein J6590_019114 [Homalodisca vitripennis]|nr:hypothetical protein J6590_019114 [Homalodisca vitripennis]
MRGSVTRQLNGESTEAFQFGRRLHSIFERQVSIDKRFFGDQICEREASRDYKPTRQIALRLSSNGSIKGELATPVTKAWCRRQSMTPRDIDARSDELISYYAVIGDSEMDLAT